MSDPKSSLGRVALRVALAGVLLGLFSACTARYSQSLVARIPKGSGEIVTSTATGLAIFQITVEEPTPAHQQVSALMANCKELTGVEVDYRDLFIIVVSIPRVTVTGRCVR